MTRLVQYNQARQNLNSYYRTFSIVMLLAGFGVIPAGFIAYAYPGIITLLWPPCLALLAGVMAYLRSRVGQQIDRLSLQSSKQLAVEETKIDRELAEVDPALGVQLRVGEAKTT